MKAKTARRWLTRNQMTNAKKRINGIKVHGFEKTCIKVLRIDAKINKDSRRLFNQLIVGKYQ